MNRRLFAAALGRALGLHPGFAAAAQERSAYRGSELLRDLVRQQGLDQGLRELGYMEDTNVVIEWRRLRRVRHS